MPHVAFQPALVLKPILNARAADRAPDASFDSLLDNLPKTDDRRPADDTRADRPEPSSANDALRADAKPSDKPDSKASEKSAGDTAKVSDADKPATDAKTETKTEPTAETKTEAKADTKPEKTEPAEVKVADAIPADALPVTITAQPVAAPVPTLTPADALAPVAAPTTEAAAQVAAAEAAAGATGAAAPTGNGKSQKLVDVPAQAGKDDETKLAAKDSTNDAPKDAAKTAAHPHEDKPQGITADSDKEALARGETQTHRAAAETSAPAADKLIDAPKPGIEASQLATLTARPQHTAATPIVPTAPAPLPQTAAVPLAGVAIEVTNKALSGTNHFEIRLDPPELGRIEVRLEVDRDGNVTTKMIADRHDTLDLLRRDQSGLERALQDAGLKTSNNGTQFSLRDHTNSQQQSSGSFETARLVVEDETPTVVAPRNYGRLAGQTAGLDIHV